MERSQTHNAARPSPTVLPIPGSTITHPGPKRLRGVITDINEDEGGGYIRLASRQFSFRAIDVIGSQSPKAGESASFVLTSGELNYRASQVVLDSNPQFIQGQSSLKDCYRAHADARKGRIARQQAASLATPASQPAQQGVEYRHCQDCQRMVLAKLRRTKSDAVRWHQFCPHCSNSLDEPKWFRRLHPLPFALLLGCALAWWLL